jgi:hypothetical protein
MLTQRTSIMTRKERARIQAQNPGMRNLRTKSSLSISDLSPELEQFLGAAHGNPGLNLKTPCPAIHLAIQDKVPADVISIILYQKIPLMSSTALASIWQ